MLVFNSYPHDQVCAYNLEAMKALKKALGHVDMEHH